MRGLVAPPGLLILTFALAATDLAPALLLAPTVASRPLAPATLILADGPGDALQQAAVLATCGVAVNLAAFALSARHWSGRLTR